MPTDLDKLQGAWTLHSLHLDGQEMPPGGGIEIDGDRFQTTGMGAEYSGMIEIDSATKPKRLDLVFTTGPEAGNRNCGIYALDADSWKLCLNMTGKSRPRSFSAIHGSGNALEIFTRTAAATDALPLVETPSGEGELVGEWQMLSASQAGHSLDERMVQTGRRVTTDTHTTTYFGKQVFLNAEYTTDPTQTPKSLDLHAKGKIQLGIYERAGDILKICFATSGKPRPTDFETRPGDGRTSATWRKL